jgi:hypothetical protein
VSLALRVNLHSAGQQAQLRTGGGKNRLFPVVKDKDIEKTGDNHD